MHSTECPYCGRLNTIDMDAIAESWTQTCQQCGLLFLVRLINHPSFVTGRYPTFIKDGFVSCHVSLDSFNTIMRQNGCKPYKAIEHCRGSFSKDGFEFAEKGQFCATRGCTIEYVNKFMDKHECNISVFNGTTMVCCGKKILQYS